MWKSHFDTFLFTAAILEKQIILLDNLTSHILWTIPPILTVEGLKCFFMEDLWDESTLKSFTAISKITWHIPANPPVLCGSLPHKRRNSWNLPLAGPLPHGNIQSPHLDILTRNDPHSYFSGLFITVNRSKQTMGDHLKTLASSFHVRFISNRKSFLPCQLQQEKGLCLDQAAV